MRLRERVKKSAQPRSQRFTFCVTVERILSPATLHNPLTRASISRLRSGRVRVSRPCPPPTTPSVGSAGNPTPGRRREGRARVLCQAEDLQIAAISSCQSLVGAPLGSSPAGRLGREELPLLPVFSLSSLRRHSMQTRHKGREMPAVFITRDSNVVQYVLAARARRHDVTQLSKGERGNQPHRPTRPPVLVGVPPLPRGASIKPKARRGPLRCAEVSLLRARAVLSHNPTHTFTVDLDFRDRETAE
ncbi:hypothetical protein E2C01_026093 [Portunus trituberculatus]|uniref:Uncharacterized protein n=1 Tax=Portunus trituberculatus TaxID=210409 RepID=A0A5B7EJR7_PORTR|nr:hypothetical protein [Portunus trituberculatus]